MHERLPGGLGVTWRYFSLEQVNERAGPGLKVWERPPGFQSTSLDAFAVAEAARRQERPEAWERLHMALLETRHGPARQHLTRPTVEGLAEAAGFDMDRLRGDRDDPTILHALARDHDEAASQGVFGTPTLVFETGHSAYMRMRPAMTGDDAMRAWTHVYGLAAEMPQIAELKRPQPPRRA